MSIDTNMAEGFKTIYRVFERNIPEIVKTANISMEMQLLIDALEQDGWTLSFREHHGTKKEYDGDQIEITTRFTAILTQGTLSAHFWYDTLCNTPWFMAFGVFRPWGEQEDEQFQRGYRNAIGLACSYAVQFGNGKPVCIFEFCWLDDAVTVIYWQSKLMENQNYYPRGTRREDEKFLLKVLMNIDPSRINQKPHVTSLGRDLLREFNLGQSE